MEETRTKIERFYKCPKCGNEIDFFVQARGDFSFCMALSPDEMAQGGIVAEVGCEEIDFHSSEYRRVSCAHCDEVIHEKKEIPQPEAYSTGSVISWKGEEVMEDNTAYDEELEEAEKFAWPYTCAECGNTEKFYKEGTGKIKMSLNYTDADGHLLESREWVQVTSFEPETVVCGQCGAKIGKEEE